jgi:hypothetical protein
MNPTAKYQADDNAAYIRLSDGEILESSEVVPKVIFDYNARGPDRWHRTAGRPGAVVRRTAVQRRIRPRHNAAAATSTESADGNARRKP